MLPTGPGVGRGLVSTLSRRRDFRGQFSYAAVLADSGQVDTALAWLRQALAGGNLKFLRTASKALAAAANPQVRAMAEAYEQRATTLSDP